MKLKYLPEKINILKKLDLNFAEILKVNYELYVENYNFINQNNFFVKKIFSKININTIKYLIQIIFNRENKILNFFEEINSLINKTFVWF